MSTRKKRHSGNKQRSWDELNRSTGHDGRMESEAWYQARTLCATDVEAAITVLVDHFGTLQAAWQAYRSLAEQPATAFKEVADRCLEGDR